MSFYFEYRFWVIPRFSGDPRSKGRKRQPRIPRLWQRRTPWLPWTPRTPWPSWTSGPYKYVHTESSDKISFVLPSQVVIMRSEVANLRDERRS